MKEKNKGITLIALVITIIVMLILVAVTINMAINGGLFDKAGDAVGKMQDEIDREKGMANGEIEIGGVKYNSIDEYLGNMGKGPWHYCVGAEDKTKASGATFYVSNGEMIIPVGAKVSYSEPTTKGKYKIDTSKGIGTGATYNSTTKKYDLAGNGEEIQTADLGYWLVLGASDEGLLELVSTYSSNSGAVTEKSNLGNSDGEIYLANQEGAINGPDLLNDVCKALYGKGTGAESARSITTKDMEKLMGVKREDYTDEDDYADYAYGKKWTYRLVKEGKISKIYVYSEELKKTSSDSIGTTFDEDTTKKWYYTGKNSFTYYDEEDKQWKTLGTSIDKQGNIITEATITDTFYYFDMSEEMGETAPLYWELRSSYFWLAARASECFIDSVNYGVADSGGGAVQGYGVVLFASSRYSDGFGCRFAPRSFSII